MILPESIYETLKFIAGIIPLIVTFLGSTLLVLGVSESTTTIVLTVVGAIGTLIKGIVEKCKSTWYKEQAEITQYIEEVMGDESEE